MASESSSELRCYLYLSFSLCYTIGKKDLHSVSFSVLSHCFCHSMSPSIFNSAQTVVSILSYTMFRSSASWAAFWRVYLPPHCPWPHYVPSSTRIEYTSFAPRDVVTCFAFLQLRSCVWNCFSPSLMSLFWQFKWPLFHGFGLPESVIFPVS